MTCEACVSGDVEKECVCQDKCEQRFDCGFSTSLTNLTFDMTSVPCGDDGERVCEGHGYNEIFCGRIGCCTWDSVEDECMSNVGQDSCQPGISILVCVSVCRYINFASGTVKGAGGEE